MLLTWRKNTSTLTRFFLLLFLVNFWPLSTFFAWQGWTGSWKLFFSVKNGISIKNIFWAILGSKMMSSLNSGCNISIRAYYLCRFITSSQGYQKYFGRLFYIYEKSSWKNGAIFHGLASIFIDNSIFLRDYNSSLWYS